MKVLFTEKIGGKTYSRMADGTYDPPLPADEIAKREARTPLFEQELRNHQVARGETDDTFLGGLPHFSDIYGETYANEVRAIWDAHGISYTSRTDYNPHWAETKGDPAGIIEGRQTGRKRQEKLDRCGDVDPFANAPRLSKNAIYESAIEFGKEHPDEFAKMTNEDVKAHMIDKHGAK